VTERILKSTVLKGNLKNISKLQKPVIVFSHGIGENALGIVRSLGRKKIPIILFVIKGYKSVVAYSKYIDFLLELPELTRDIILNEIIFLNHKNIEKPVLFFDNCKMVNLLHNDKELLKKYCYLTQDIGDFTDKTFQFDVAKKAKVTVPKTWKPKTWIEFTDQIVTSNRLIAKPDFASGNKPFKLLIADNINELKTQLGKYVTTPQGLLIQEYIEGTKESIWVSLGYRSSLTGKIFLMTAIKYLMNPVYGGVMAVGKVINNEDVKNESLKLINAFDYNGIFGFEFKFSAIDNCYYYIEMSPRTEGFHNITTLAGIDLPLFAYKDLHSETVDLYKSPSSGLYWFNARYTIDSFIESKCLVVFLKSIKSSILAREYQQFAWDDFMPFMKGTSWYLRSLIQKFNKKIKHFLR
jgi:predicted ATP-grasp superfamily ATP-dependent carboligase